MMGMAGGFTPLGGDIGGMLRPAHIQVDPKKARTAYVGGLTPGITQDLLRRFFEEQLPLVAERPPHRGPAVETVSINSNGMYGFVEFYKNYDADIAMCMDGMKLNGVQLQVRRPKNYTPLPNAKKYTIPGLISSRVPDGPNKVFLGGLPLNLGDAEVQQIAASFGQLAAFSLIKDRTGGMSKGYAFFQYADVSLTHHVCAALNGREIHGKIVVCKPANQKDFGGMESMEGMAPQGMGALGMGGMGGMGMGGIPGMPMAFGGLGLPQQPTTHLQLANMVSAQELQDDAEYKDILEDVTSECRQYGNVLKVFIPRPPHHQAGLIFLQYSQASEAAAAFQALSGRTFANRIIAVTYITQAQWPL
jgi:splicing factor U2AF subunit